MFPYNPHLSRCYHNLHHIISCSIKSLSLSLSETVCLSIYPLFFSISLIYISISSVCLSFCLCVYLSVCLSVSVSVSLSAYISSFSLCFIYIYIYIYLYISLLSLFLSLYLSVPLFVSASLSLPLSLFYSLAHTYFSSGDREGAENGHLKWHVIRSDGIWVTYMVKLPGLSMKK